MKDNVIKKAIRKKNMTSKEAAESMNMNAGKLSHLTSGMKPSYHNYMKLRKFGISEKDLKNHFEKGD